MVSQLTKQAGQRLTRIRCTHERLADQERIDTRRAHPQHILAGMDTALAHQQSVTRNIRQQPAAWRPALSKIIGFIRAAERSALMNRREFRMPSI